MINKKNVFKVANLNNLGSTFNVLILFNGDKYGLNNCLTHCENDPLVEFYDASLESKEGFGELGQFISRYYSSTLLERSAEHGLCLDGANSDIWSLEASSMKLVNDFITTRLNS